MKDANRTQLTFKICRNHFFSAFFFSDLDKYVTINVPCFLLKPVKFEALLGINLPHQALVRICHGSSRLCTAAGADDTGGVSCAQKSQSLGPRFRKKTKMSQIDVDAHLLIYEYISTDQLISLHNMCLHHDLISF